MIKHVYRLDSPVDFWSFVPGKDVPSIREVLTSIESALDEAIVVAGKEELTEMLIEAQLEIITDRRTITEKFKALGEEFRGEDGVIAVPDGYAIERAYLVKADNNGTTYLFSPVDLREVGGEEV